MKRYGRKKLGRVWIGGGLVALGVLVTPPFVDLIPIELWAWINGASGASGPHRYFHLVNVARSPLQEVATWLVAAVLIAVGWLLLRSGRAGGGNSGAA